MPCTVQKQHISRSIQFRVANRCNHFGLQTSAAAVDANKQPACVCADKNKKTHRHEPTPHCDSPAITSIALSISSMRFWRSSIVDHGASRLGWRINGGPEAKPLSRVARTWPRRCCVASFAATGDIEVEASFGVESEAAAAVAEDANIASRGESAATLDESAASEKGGFVLLPLAGDRSGVLSKRANSPLQQQKKEAKLVTRNDRRRRRLLSLPRRLGWRRSMASARAIGDCSRSMAPSRRQLAQIAWHRARFGGERARSSRSRLLRLFVICNGGGSVGCFCVARIPHQAARTSYFSAANVPTLNASRWQRR